MKMTRGDLVQISRFTVRKTSRSEQRAGGGDHPEVTQPGARALRTGPHSGCFVHYSKSTLKDSELRQVLFGIRQDINKFIKLNRELKLG